MRLLQGARPNRDGPVLEMAPLPAEGLWLRPRLEDEFHAFVGPLPRLGGVEIVRHGLVRRPPQEPDHQAALGQRVEHRQFLGHAHRVAVGHDRSEQGDLDPVQTGRDERRRDDRGRGQDSRGVVVLGDAHPVEAQLLDELEARAHVPIGLGAGLVVVRPRWHRPLRRQGAWGTVARGFEERDLHGPPSLGRRRCQRGSGASPPDVSTNTPAEATAGPRSVPCGTSQWLAIGVTLHERKGMVTGGQSYMETAIHSFTLFATAIGRCGIVWGGRGIVGVQLPEARESETRARVLRRFPTAREAAPPPEVHDALDGIVALLRGEALALESIRLDMEGVPPFHRRVYEVARTIPPGKTLSYGEIAARLGANGSARAVGEALAHNPFAIVVPCHRVLAAGGRMGGFSAGGGVATKRRLLSIEGAPGAGQQALFDGDVAEGVRA